MKATTICHFERGESDEVVANVSGTVSRHFGRLEVADFESDIPLSADEQEEAEDKLCEVAPSFGYIPEEEPDARRYGI